MRQRKVSIHTPMWGATIFILQVFFDILFQSTLPRGERRPCFWTGTPNICVSIHAPTRGATCCQQRIVVSLQVSIHAPTWGATVCPPWHQSNFPSFNPRPHVGSDMLSPRQTSELGYFNPRSHVGSDLQYPLKVQIITVSIHAPT